MRVIGLTFTDYLHKFEYPFGAMYCFNNYVVTKLHADVDVNTAIATRLISDINNYFKKNKIVYISDREFGYTVDPKVYKAVNTKILIGIAIVGTTNEQKIQASGEQSLFNGSFGYFSNMESAIEWAKSFTKDTDSSS